MSKELTADNLSQRTKEIVQFYVLNPDKTHQEIADKFSLSRGRVTHILNNDRVKKVYPILMKRHIDSNGVLMAGKAYIDVIKQNQSYPSKEKAAKAVLMSNGVLSGEKTNVQISVEGELRLKSVQELSQIVQKAKDLPQIVIEAELSDEQVS